MQYKLHCCALQKVKLNDLMKWIDLLNSTSVYLRTTNCSKTEWKSGARGRGKTGITPDYPVWGGVANGDSVH